MLRRMKYIKRVIVDLIGLLGLVMLGYGLWLIAPVCMYVGIGALLCIVSGASAWLGRGE